MTVNVLKRNDAPVAVLDSATINEDSSIILDVLKYASDIDGDSLSIASVSDASHGSVNIVTELINFFPPKITKN